MSLDEEHDLLALQRARTALGPDNVLMTDDEVRGTLVYQGRRLTLAFSALGHTVLDVVRSAAQL
jgi:hypothetical protein